MIHPNDYFVQKLFFPSFSIDNNDIWCQPWEMLPRRDYIDNCTLVEMCVEGGVQSYTVVDPGGVIEVMIYLKNQVQKFMCFLFFCKKILKLYNYN